MLDNFYLSGEKWGLRWEKGLGVDFSAKKHILGMIMRFEDVESTRDSIQNNFYWTYFLKHKNLKTC